MVVVFRSTLDFTASTAFRLLANYGLSGSVEVPSLVRLQYKPPGFAWQESWTSCVGPSSSTIRASRWGSYTVPQKTPRL